MTGVGAAERPPPKRPPSRAPPAGAVEIVTPDQGATVRGRAAPTGTIAAPVRLSGHADALQVVRVDGRCPARPCTKFAYTGAQGRWTARLQPRRAAPHPSLDRDRRLRRHGGRRHRCEGDLRRPRRQGPGAPARPQERSASRAGRRDHHPAAGQPANACHRAAPTPTPAPSSGAGGTLVLVGDSLAVGVQSLLPAALPGWKVQVLARVGRPLAEGMSVLAGVDLAAATRVRCSP